MQHTPLKRGTSSPLFDRIIDPKLGMTALPALLDGEGLRASIVRELSLVLNTRCTVQKILYEAHFETISLFGMPDFFGLRDFSAPEFDGSNTQEWPQAARAIEMAIQAAEPRLDNIRVTIEGYDATTQTLATIVQASLKHSAQQEAIHFPLSLTHIPSVFA